MKAAKKPAIRTVAIALDPPFDGWQATLRANPPWRILTDLESGDMARVIAGFDGLVISHNFPDETGEVATSMGDVDPSDAVTEMARKYPEAVGALPPR